MPGISEEAGPRAGSGAGDQDRSSIGGAEAFRWAVVAALIVAGLVLFFFYGKRTAPVVAPSAVEASP